MNIAICDDCLRDIKILEMVVLEIIGDEKAVKFYEFLSGKELLEQYLNFDIIFLDIQMDGELSGTQTAEQIRLQDPEALISFYTAYDYPASNIVNVRPFSYLMKDFSEDKVKTILKLIIEEAYKRKRCTSIFVDYNAKTYKVDISEILYIAILDKGSAIYLTKKGAERIRKFADSSETMATDNILKSSVKLDEYYKQLKSNGFIYGKKSYIINIRHIIARLKDSVKMNDGTELMIARSKKKEFNEQLSEYWGKYRKRD